MLRSYLYHQMLSGNHGSKKEIKSGKSFLVSLLILHFYLSHYYNFDLLFVNAC